MPDKIKVSGGEEIDFAPEIAREVEGLHEDLGHQDRRAQVDHDATREPRDGRREAMSDWSGALQLMTMSPGGTEVTERPRSAIPSLLAERFALQGFALASDGRVA